MNNTEKINRSTRAYNCRIDNVYYGNFESAKSENSMLYVNNLLYGDFKRFKPTKKAVKKVSILKVVKND